MCNKSYFTASAEWASNMGFFDDIEWKVMKNIKFEDEYCIEFHDESNGDCGGVDGMGFQCYISVSFRFDACEEIFYYETTYNGSSIFAMNMCEIEWTHYCEDCDEYIEERDGWDDYKGKCEKCVEEEEEEDAKECGCCKKE